MKFEHRHAQKQAQSQTQRLALSLHMRQSLEVLRMPLDELARDILAEIQQNPLLELEPEPAQDAPEGEDPFAQLALAEGGDEEPEQEVEASFSEREWGDMPRASGEVDLAQMARTPQQSFVEMLREQLAVMELEPGFLRVCEYLVECLDRRGYLDFELADIAADLAVDEFEVTQALFAVQGLVPAGVGARSLTECLVLQLVHSAHFNQYTLRIAGEGLALLARGDMAGLAALLGCDMLTAQTAAAAVKSLNPLPSRGYYTGERSIQIIPDAMVQKQAGGLHIVMNSRALPRLEISSETRGLLAAADDEEAKAYLQAKLQDAQSLKSAVEGRLSTLQRVLGCIVELQPAYFKDGVNLVPMTLSDVATRLELHVSTVSRAVQDKYIVCTAGTVHLKSLFSQPAAAGEGTGGPSSVVVKQMIRRCVKAEDGKKPLSDEAIRAALEAMGAGISRRTVAKYREELGIPKAAGRRQL